MSEKSSFQELVSQVDGVIFHPLTPWLALSFITIFWILSQVGSKIPEDPIDRLKRTFGAESMPHFVAASIVLLWGILFALLFFGLINVIIETAFSINAPQDSDGLSVLSFHITKAAALTAILGGLVALPFTALRIKLSNEQNRHNEAVLLNEKLNDANNDLHARYQKTKEYTDGTSIDIWKDDIIRRNGAIDRLEDLATKNIEIAPRIARILCVYLKEMSREHPAKKTPEDLKDLWDWQLDKSDFRSDMENAVIALGNMPRKTGLNAKKLHIDLSDVNMQKMRLIGLDFSNANMKRSHFDGAILNGSKFYGTDFQYCKFVGTAIIYCKLDKQTNFEEASILCSILRDIDLASSKNVPNLDQHNWGDMSVKVPTGSDIPTNWLNEISKHEIFMSEISTFKQDPDAYIPPQLRKG